MFPRNISLKLRAFCVPAFVILVFAVNAGSARRVNNPALRLNQHLVQGGCSVTPIVIGQTINASLAPSDCSFIGTSQSVDVYSFSAKAGQRIAVVMSSFGFDAHSYLIDSNNQLVDEYGAGGSRASEGASPRSSFLTLPATGNYLIYATARTDKGDAGTGAYSLTLVEPQLVGAALQLTSQNYFIGEGGGSVQVIAIRSDHIGPASVDYTTSDTAGLNECNVFNNAASSRCDYATSIGTLRFADGDDLKTIFIPIVDDSYAEGNETFKITISNPVGVALSTIISATINIQDNETVNGTNPIDGVDFFIRQNYIDFLGREPDPAGLAGWRNVLNNCGTSVPPPCDRIEVSAGFFRSEEFQSRGYFIYRFYSAVGRIPLSGEFFPDFAKVSGFLTPEQLEANKVAYVNEFIARAEFQTKYSATFNDPTGYVNALLQTVGLPNHPSRAGWIATLTTNNTAANRALVLRQLVESAEVYNKYYNEAFVIMQYFGYLRRTADASYLNWIQTMNQTGGDYRIMINGFMNSAEYRRRFGP